MNIMVDNTNQARQAGPNGSNSSTAKPQEDSSQNIDFTRFGVTRFIEIFNELKDKLVTDASKLSPFFELARSSMNHELAASLLNGIVKDEHTIELVEQALQSQTLSKDIEAFSQALEASEFAQAVDQNKLKTLKQIAEDPSKSIPIEISNVVATSNPNTSNLSKWGRYLSLGGIVVSMPDMFRGRIFSGIWNLCGWLMIGAGVVCSILGKK